MQPLKTVVARLIAAVGGGGDPSPTTPPASMPPEDAEVIRLFAAGHIHLRSEAIIIHRRYIATLGVRGSAEMRFMAEVDTPCPDLGLRARYRRDLLVKEAA